MDQLRTEVAVGGERFQLYNAGTKNGQGWFGVFPRDLLTTGLMVRDPHLLRETLGFCARTMGRQPDARTGEEPGRVLHEFTPAERDGLSSRYNACETTQLFVIAARCYLEVADDPAFLVDLGDQLEAAAGYLLRHLRDGMFWEDPRFCGAVRYMAHATYWKDSHLPARRRLQYPVAYTLVQAQTAAALRALAHLAGPLGLGQDPHQLRNQAEAVVGSIARRLWDGDRAHPLIALDAGQPVPGISSDGLHMLAYLEPGDLPAAVVHQLWQGAQQLVTPFGFRSYAPDQPDYSPYAYHLGAVWPHEQFFLARGALAHGLGEAGRVCLGALDALAELGFVELFYWSPQEGLKGPGVVPGEGCDRQLWTTALPQALGRLVGG